LTGHVVILAKTWVCGPPESQNTEAFFHLTNNSTYPLLLLLSLLLLANLIVRTTHGVREVLMIDLPGGRRAGYSLNSSALREANPPAISTVPFCNKVAECAHLAPVMLPVEAKIPGTGAYSSALAKNVVNCWLSFPPATSTIPLGNNVAVSSNLASDMLPVAANVAALGSYSSAVSPPLFPPAMSTFPLGSNVAE
jgi:hypothetical protein